MYKRRKYNKDYVYTPPTRVVHEVTSIIHSQGVRRSRRLRNLPPVGIVAPRRSRRLRNLPPMVIEAPRRSRRLRNLPPAVLQSDPVMTSAPGVVYISETESGFMITTSSENGENTDLPEDNTSDEDGESSTGYSSNGTVKSATIIESFGQRYGF